jgi:hypothetical protein
VSLYDSISPTNPGGKCLPAARTVGRVLAALFLAGLAAGMAPAQAGVAWLHLPAPDPGYGLYYRDTGSSSEVGSRWGYHEGWMEGRHDRDQGDPFPPEEKEHYRNPPPHLLPAGVTREEYVRSYRIAYARGYQHGSRI